MNRIISIPARSFWQSIGAVMVLVLAGLATVPAAAQNPNIAEAYDPQGLGFYLKKVVSNTTICSGQTFSYTVYFTLPAGTQTATITDNIPSPLLVQSVSISACGSSPTVNAPPAGTNGPVSVSWASGQVPPGGCSGSLVIVVSFPNGTTCNGTGARNRVCMTGTIQTPQGLQTAEFCTPYVSTTAQAVNPWQLQKQPLGATPVGGNCPWKYPGDTISYVIRVCKNNPAPCGPYGQLNLVGATVTDVLPSGAQFVSASPSIGSVTVSGNTITWNIGTMSATAPYNCAACTLTVAYPSAQFPSGTQITNTATLTGQLGDPQQPCPNSQFTQNSTLCWEKSSPPPPPPPTTTATLWKGVSTNGQPGCSGQYTIRLCNTGTTAISAATITDTLPAALSILSWSVWPSSGLTVSVNGNIVTATLTSPLNPGQCRFLFINFTIDQNATPGSTITNCAWAQVQGLTQLLQSCASFVVNAPAPAACVQKQICSPQPSYAPGQIVRMRLRLQNIGGLPITGATLTDVLDPNLEYVGNPAFYSSSSYSTPCNPSSGTTPWTPAPSLSVSGQTITVSNITIPATCQNLFWNGCGFYGNTGVPYYWIEFDVKIRDTAALGNIPNNFTLSGGGLPQPVQSNTVLLLVTGTCSFTLDKAVAPDTTNWQSSLVTSAGATVNYRLRMLPSGTAPLRHVTFVDLLPRDNAPADSKILQGCFPRGSQFDITYQSLLLSSPAGATGYNNPATTLATPNGIAPLTLFPVTCGNAGTWASGLSGAGYKNIGFYWGSPIGASNPPTIVFGGKIDTAAQPGQIACNTFAAGAAVRHLLNSQTPQDVPIGPLESTFTCVTIDSSNACYSVQLHGSVSVIGTVPTPAGDACQYRLVVAINNPGPATQGCVSTSEGTISPSTFSVPTGLSTLTFTFTDLPPATNFACFVFGTQNAAGACTPCDTLCIDLPSCPRPDTCCPRFNKVDIKCIGRDSAGNMIYSITVKGTLPCKASVVITSPDGSFTPSAFSAGPGNFTVSTTFTDLPPAAAGSITVSYTVFGNGVVLCSDSAKLKLPQCPQQPRNCCDGWQRSLQSQVKWFSNGAVVITGTATAAPAPISRFTAAIVSAQLRRMCPLPGPWQRIYGDITSASLVPAPGAPVLLTPFSRQVSWEGPIPDSCVRWSESPATFTLNLLFPAPPTWPPCRDSLRFTVRYTFTDCECRTCDTLIAYTVVRWKKKWQLPWDAIAVQRPAPNQIELQIPGTRAVSEDSSAIAQLSLVELQGLPIEDVRVTPGGYIPGAGIVSARRVPGGVIVLVPGDADASYRVLLTLERGTPDTIRQARLRLTWDEIDARSGQSESVSEDRELGIPPYSQRQQPTGVLVQDRESMPPFVRTFALAFVNGELDAEGVEIELKALPQPDGTVPTILAFGPPDGDAHVIKCKAHSCCCFAIQLEKSLRAGEVYRPLFVTVAGGRRDGLDAVELEYEVRDATGTTTGKGRVLLEGAVSKIENADGETVGQGVQVRSIVPNPATESVTISLQSFGTSSNVEVGLYDALGRQIGVLLRGATLPDGITAIPLNVANLSPGVYTVVVRSGHNVAARQFVVTR